VPAAATLSGAQVRAHRILASGLARTVDAAAALPLWDLGVQDRDGSARLAFAARLADPGALPAIDDPAGSGASVLAWSLRGSPHLHRRTDLQRFAGALWPADDADAAARLSGDAARLQTDGADPLEAYAAVSDAMRAVITAPMVKGAASAAVTAAIPAEYSGFCRGCGSVHVRELLFRLAALPAAIGALPDTRPIVLAPLAKPFPRPERQQGLGEVAAAYYRAYGVGTPSDVATHVGTSGPTFKPELPDDLVPVTVDGARSQARAGMLDELRNADLAAAAGITRLIPPSDPLLQPRDRGVLTGERDQQRALWPTLGLPGAVLAGGGIAGLWRTRLAGRTLTLTVTPWRRLGPVERAALAEEAQLVGSVRGAARTSLLIA
jgi:hypothetical protein